MTRYPKKFTEHLELLNIILEVADDLWHDCTIDDPYSELTDEERDWETKYFKNRPVRPTGGNI
jgi:hypothetical protein